MALVSEQSFNLFQNQTEQRDFILYPELAAQLGYASPRMDINIIPGSFAYRQHARYEEAPSYQDMQAHFMYNNKMSSNMYFVDCDMRVPSSHLSTTFTHSAPSFTLGSPSSNHGQLSFIHSPQHLGTSHGIIGQGEYFSGKDPSLDQPEIRGPMPPPTPQVHEANDTFQFPQNIFINSPSLSGTTSPVPDRRHGRQSPYQQHSLFAAPPHPGCRQSLSSYHSHGSHEYTYNADESKEKQRCPHPDCGNIFKDLKTHLLTHQNERPEKCSIQTCDYHIKGFARKYDKNRHILTHYRGTMVCGFCPGLGTTAEKSFNRADVFKRHLTTVHGVKQTAPNSRNKCSTSVNSVKRLTRYAPEATGKCSTCSATFSNVQDFYEHLDDCVLRIVQQQDPAEAINAKRLSEVEDDTNVLQTLEKNHLPITRQMASTFNEDDDEEVCDDDDEDSKASKIQFTAKNSTAVTGVSKSRGMTHSRGGVSLHTKSKNRRNRKSRRDYPSSWGIDKGQMTMKKRVITVFDGPRRLAKDDTMLSTEYEVRTKLSDGQSYVTDLDINTMMRTEGFHGATEEEKGPWVSDDPIEGDIARVHACHIRPVLNPPNEWVALYSRRDCGWPSLHFKSMGEAIMRKGNSETGQDIP